MVVDDAVVVRGLFTRWFSDEPDMVVVGSCRNGYEAVENLLRINPDVVVLDIDMPEMDGLAALPLLLAKRPDLIVLIASTLTRRNAEVSIKALTLGAADYVLKPQTNREVTTSQSFRRELIEKIRQLGRSIRSRSRARAPARDRMLEDVGEPKAPPIKLRPFSMFPPRVLLIGSSTGGPQALQVVMRGLAPVLGRLSLLITQHMPPTFTTILAEHLGRATMRPAHEAIQGEMIVPGTIYVAPGGKHLRIERQGNGAKIVLDDGPPVHFSKPAVDPLFSSAAVAYGAGALAVVLTGMGSDGAEGASRIADAGGNVIAQDEPTSVVWGMPGAAAHAGACAAVLPLDEIAPRIVRLVTGENP
jgi:two-component system chemotaxis response regulator CheB